jgi:hypothetical protein
MASMNKRLRTLYVTAALALALAAAATIPFLRPFYSPAMPGRLVAAATLRPSGAWLSDRVMLSDKTLSHVDIQRRQDNAEMCERKVLASPAVGAMARCPRALYNTHERYLGVYRFIWPLWRRLDFESGDRGHFLKFDTAYGDDSAQNGSFTVGVILDILGTGSFLHDGGEQLVVHYHSIGGSGQYVDGFVVGIDRDGVLHRAALVENYMGLKASIVGDVLRLSGDKHDRNNCPTCVTQKGLIEDLRFDGLHWGLLPDPVAFSLEEGSP